MNQKVTVGQKLFSLNVGNAARHRVQILTPVVVTKVGRKYFTVKTDDKYGFETEYNLEDWEENTEYTRNSVLYETEQQWYDEKELGAICQHISKAFEHGRNQRNLSIGTIRAISELIYSNQNQKLQ